MVIKCQHNNCIDDHVIWHSLIYIISNWSFITSPFAFLALHIIYCFKLTIICLLEVCHSKYACNILEMGRQVIDGHSGLLLAQNLVPGSTMLINPLCSLVITGLVTMWLLVNQICRCYFTCVCPTSESFFYWAAVVIESDLDPECRRVLGAILSVWDAG